MQHDQDSLTARLAEAAGLAPESRALHSFGRDWTYARTAERVERMTLALAGLGVGPDKPLGLLLPPVPTAAMATLAAFRLGAPVVPCHPMQTGDELLARLHDVGGGVLVTLDLTRLQDRWVRLIGETGIDAVLVEKMTELLPFPRNLLLPMMRGGEIASIPRNDRTAPLPKLLRAADPGADPPAGDTFVQGAFVQETGGRRSGEDAMLASMDELLRIAGGAGRWMIVHHMEDAWALAGTLAPITAGRALSVMPRLDRRTVARALDKERPQVALLAAGVAEELAGKPPPPGALELAVVPPSAPNRTVKLLKRAAGCRVAVWDGPQRS